MTDNTADIDGWRFVIAHARPGQGEKVARALALLLDNGGFGQIVLDVSDGLVGSHPKARLGDDPEVTVSI